MRAKRADEPASLKFYLICTDRFHDTCEYMADSLEELVDCMRANSALESRTYPIFDGDSDSRSQDWPWDSPVVAYITKVDNQYFANEAS